MARIQTGATGMELRHARTLTNKGKQNYEETVSEYTEQLRIQRKSIEEMILTFAEFPLHEDAEFVKTKVQETYKNYCIFSERFVTFLQETRTKESESELAAHVVVNRAVRSKVDLFIHKLEEFKQSEFMEQRKPDPIVVDTEQPFTETIIKKESATLTQDSRNSTHLSKVRARYEATKTKAKYAELTAKLIKEQAQIEEDEAITASRLARKKKDLETSLNLITIQQEAEEAEAEFGALMEEMSITSGDHVHSLTEEKRRRTCDFLTNQSDIMFSSICPPVASERPPSLYGTRLNSFSENLVGQGNKIATSTPRNKHSDSPIKDTCASYRPIEPSNNTPCVGTEFTKFLVKKELLLSRLSAFNDRPENYLMWKGSFSIIMKDLSVTPMEELDLLVKFLGPESKQQAMRLRASHPSDPIKGLDRIWERLDERYGSPELVEAILKEKIVKFPKITVKDTRKMYELSDIAAEVESVKENPKYSTLLAYYDSSSGVNTFVNKLPGFLQSKWTDRALKYKVDNDVLYPPFVLFTKFLKEMSIRMNDPSFVFDKGFQPMCESKETVAPEEGHVITNKTKLTPKNSSKCPLHETDKHALSECRTFNSKPIAERKYLIRQNNLCFRCCNGKHIARECHEHVVCAECNSNRHCTAMHEDRNSTVAHSGEDSLDTQVKSFRPSHETYSTNPNVRASCTQVCGREGFKGKSCAKTVLVNIYPEYYPEHSLKAYVLIDDQSNRSLARSEFFDYFNMNTPEIEYALSSCSGQISTTGRQASGFVIESLDGNTKLPLPTLIECNQIPNTREEIPTPEVARYHEHLSDIADEIPPYDPGAPILLLIGRDMIAAHHVLDQRIGQSNSPCAQKLRFGWVVIGETCLGVAHKPNTITANKVHVLSSGRSSILRPCPNEFELKTDVNKQVSEPVFGDSVFLRTGNDDKMGHSVEDKEFIRSTVWKFNAPHSSHMSGAWERMIEDARRIPDSMLSNLPGKGLSHEVLCTLMTEVCAIMNSRPFAAVSPDPDSPTALSPATLLTQKMGQHLESFQQFGVKDLIKSQWRQVQFFVEQFWTKWKEKYLTTLQVRQKWTDERLGGPKNSLACRCY